jgi:hypothetical protein
MMGLGFKLTWIMRLMFAGAALELLKWVLLAVGK